MAKATPFASLDAPPLAALLKEVHLGRDKFEALIDPGVDEVQAATCARHIAIATFDQGCCGPATPHAIRALLDALGHPDCRAPAQLMRVLGDYLFRNAEQLHGPDSDDLYEGFDTRLPRWAPFKGERWAFLRDIHLALAAGVPLYLAHLEHPDPDVREAASYVLAPRYPRRRVLSAVEARLSVETDPLALAGAALTVALHHRYRRSSKLVALEPLLNHEHAAVRAASAIALANHGPKQGRSGTRALLTAARADATLQVPPRARGVSLARNNLREGAARALGRLPEDSNPFAELDDNSIIKRDSFLDQTVARAAAQSLMGKLRKLPEDLGQTRGKTRERLEALALRPAAWSRAVEGRFGTPLELARSLGLRPQSALDRAHGGGTLGEWLGAQLIGTRPLEEVLGELPELTPHESLDLAEELLSTPFRQEQLVFPWPDERPSGVVHRLRAEGARRDARSLVFAFALARAAAEAIPDELRRRAHAAIGDRLGIRRALAVLLLADQDVQVEGPPPESSSRVLRCVAHLPEFVPRVRAYLERLPAAERYGVLSGWEPQATGFYVDLLEPAALLRWVSYADLNLEPAHSLPFLEGLRSSEPELHSSVMRAIARRQGDGVRFEHRAGARQVTVALADAESLELWSEPTPAALSQEIKPFWP